MSSAASITSAGVTILNSDYDAFDALLHNICEYSSPSPPHRLTLSSDERTLPNNWFIHQSSTYSTGVCLRVNASTTSPNVNSNHDAAPGSTFRVFPYENPALYSFEENVRKLNPAVAVKIKNPSVHVVLASS